MAFSTESYPGVAASLPVASRGFTLNHTMLRVKDPAVSLDFYSRVMGMRVLRKLDFPEMKFSLYFLARVDDRILEHLLGGPRDATLLRRQTGVATPIPQCTNKIWFCGKHNVSNYLRMIFSCGVIESMKP